MLRSRVASPKRKRLKIPSIGDRESQILALLETAPQTHMELCARLGWSKGTLYIDVQRLVARGVVEHIGHGEPYRLVKQGAPMVVLAESGSAPAPDQP